MEGNPRYTIHVSALVFQLAHAHARQAGYKTTSDWLRALLWAWNEEPLEPRARRDRTISVRLSPPLEQRLAHVAEVSDTTRAKAFALLVERALLEGVNLPPASDHRSEPAPESEPRPKRKKRRARHPITRPNTLAQTPAIPAPHDHQGWSQVILDAARATPHKFGPGRAFIAGVLDELIERFQPDDPKAFGDMVRTMLPDLNRQGLVPLSRADLVASMDPRLVQESAIQHLNATFHFVNLN